MSDQRGFRGVASSPAPLGAATVGFGRRPSSLSRQSVRMINDVLKQHPCSACGEHRERVRTVCGRLAKWWLVRCVCGERWIPAVAWSRPRTRAA
jgi:hypothetical protein